MDERGDRFSQVLKESVDLLHKYVLPLYTYERAKPVQIGSGFVVNVRNTSLLVSAAHVVRELPVRELFYYIAPNRTRKVNERRVLGRVSDGEWDRLDVGGAILTGESAPPYPAVEKFAIELDYLKPQYLPRTGKEYVIIGYPASKNKVIPRSGSVIVAPYAYHSEVAPKETYANLRLSPETHVVLPLDLKVGFDSTGRHRNLPKPQGMSGSPVWVLYEDPELADSRTFPVVAVGTSYSKRSKALIATDIAVVVNMINALF